MNGQRTILVTGASGTLGSQLLYELTRRGERPIALVRPSSDTSYIDSLGLEKRLADLRNQEELRQAVRGTDVIFHAAAWVSFRQDRLTQFTGINTFGPVYMYRAAHEAGVRRFVHLSSVVAVGAVPRGGAPLTEDTEFNLSHLQIPYCLTKNAAELELLKVASSGGPDLVILNPPTMIAPSRTGDEFTRTQRFLMRRVQPRFTNRINLADMRDVAPAVVEAMDRARPGHRYLLTGENIAVTELVKLVARLRRRSAWQIPVPRRLIHLLAHANEWYVKSRGKGRLSFYPDLARMLDYDWVYDNSKAKRELGFSPRPLEETLSDLFSGNFTGTWLRPQ